MKLPLSRIAELVSGATTGNTPAGSVATGYSIDSRTIRPGELFFAVKGENMDGHDFVAQALEKGAVAEVVSRERFSEINRLAANPNDAEGRARTPAVPRSSFVVIEATL